MEFRPEFIAEVWKTMESADHHVYQILTKRPENMKQVIESLGLTVASHIWLGTSVESEKFVERVSILRDTPAAIRFVSFEPLLGAVGPVDLSRIHWAIVGGESGPGSRPIELKWVREIKAQCRKHDTAFFFKQWGGTNKKASGREYYGRTWDEYPAEPALNSAES